MIGNKIEFYEQHFGGVIKLPYQSILLFVSSDLFLGLSWSQILRLGCPLGDILSKLFPPSSLVHYSKTNYVVTQQLGPAVVHLQYKLLLFSVLLMECDATEIQYINSLFFPRSYFLSYNFKYINRGGY